MLSTMRPVALTIAGSDPCGGAGIQADLKTFHQFGVYGEAVLTLLTVQNTKRVDRVECLAAEFVLDQLRAVLDDIPPAAAKTGALGNVAIVEAIAEAAGEAGSEDISMEDVLGKGTRKQPAPAKETVDEDVPQVETQTY